MIPVPRINHCNIERVKLIGMCWGTISRKILGIIWKGKNILNGNMSTIGAKGVQWFLLGIV
jgi:hypothetical protein